MTSSRTASRARPTSAKPRPGARAPSASHAPAQIVGMMYDFKLFIARLGDDGAPEAYAIVQGTGVNLEPIDKLFGAAWYLDTGTFVKKTANLKFTL